MPTGKLSLIRMEASTLANYPMVFGMATAPTQNLMEGSSSANTRMALSGMESITANGFLKPLLQASSKNLSNARTWELRTNMLLTILVTPM